MRRHDPIHPLEAPLRGAGAGGRGRPRPAARGEALDAEAAYVEIAIATTPQLAEVAPRVAHCLAVGGEAFEQAGRPGLADRIAELVAGLAALKDGEDRPHRPDTVVALIGHRWPRAKPSARLALARLARSAPPSPHDLFPSRRLANHPPSRLIGEVLLCNRIFPTHP